MVTKFTVTLVEQLQHNEPLCVGDENQGMLSKYKVPECDGESW